MTLRVVHLISGLGQGGAETVLTRLVTHSSQKNIVVSFGEQGPMGDLLQKAGIEVHCLHIRSGAIGLGDFFRLVKLLKTLKPDVVQTWMYHADFFGGIAARKAGCRHIAWGIRNSGDSLKKSSKISYYLARVSAFFSRFIPQKIIVCGEKAAQIHAMWGYDRSKMQVIQNGYDLSQWQEDKGAARALRRQWGVTENTPLVGFVARWNPLKDHPSLIKAFALVKKTHQDAVLVLVGKGLDKENPDLLNALKEAQLQLSRDVILLGMRSDIPAVMSALDIHVLSSIAEGFPNVVCEAMACKTPNVVTDVGDAALIVGQDGWVAQPHNPLDLADKINSALAFLGKPKASHQQQQQFAQLQTKVRQSVLNRFSLSVMVHNYEQAWKSMLNDGR